MIEPIFAVGRKELCSLMSCKNYRTAKSRLKALHVPILEIGNRPAVAIRFLEQWSIEASKLIKRK